MAIQQIKNSILMFYVVIYDMYERCAYPFNAIFLFQKMNCKCFSAKTICVCVILAVLSYLISIVDTTHQRWWLYGCQCSNWESRNSVREVVMNSYRGLFVGRDDLNTLPVVKLHKNPGEDALTSYVANTLPNINRFINPGCCST